MRTKLIAILLAGATLSAASAVSAQSLGRISPFGQSVSTRSASERLLEEQEQPDVVFLTSRKKGAPEDSEEPPPADPWFWLASPLIGKGPSDQLGGVTAILANTKNEFDLSYTHIDPDGVGSLSNVTALYKRILFSTDKSPWEVAAEVKYDTVEDTVDTTSLTMAISYGFNEVISANVNAGYKSADINAAGTIDDFTTSAGLKFAIAPTTVIAVDREFDSDLGDASNSAGITYSRGQGPSWKWDLTLQGYAGDTYIAYAVFPL